MGSFIKLSLWLLVATLTAQAQGSKNKKFMFHHDGQDVEINYSKAYLQAKPEDNAKRNKEVSILLKEGDKLTAGHVLHDLQTNFGVHVYDAGSAAHLGNLGSDATGIKSAVMNHVVKWFLGKPNPIGARMGHQIPFRITGYRGYRYADKIESLVATETEKKESVFRFGFFKMFKKRRSFASSYSIPLFEVPSIGYFWYKLAHSGLNGLDVTVAFMERNNEKSKGYQIVYPLQEPNFLIPHPIIFVRGHARMADYNGLLSEAAPRTFAYNLMVSAGIAPTLADFGSKHEASHELISAALMTNYLLYSGSLADRTLGVETKKGTLLSMKAILKNPVLLALTKSIQSSVSGDNQ